MKSVFSFDADKTATSVIEYIKYLNPNQQIQRVLGGVINHLNIKIDKGINIIELGKDVKNVFQLNRKSSWLRRGIIKVDISDLNTISNKKVYRHLETEMEFIRSFVYDYSLSLGSYHKEIHNNRLTNLILAQDCGLAVPPTLVTTSKKELLEFYNENNFKIVSKPIHNGHLFFSEGSKAYVSKGTEILNANFISELESSFAASLFQGYIEKAAELRIFVLKGEIFPMAIFSQLDEKTKIDYRNYNLKKPNRNVPFRLPIEIESSVLEFMSKINLDTGSIDIILTPNDDFYFLEVNPTGQFGWLSKECNYYIEKHIAQNFIHDGI